MSKQKSFIRRECKLLSHESKHKKKKDDCEFAECYWTVPLSLNVSKYRNLQIIMYLRV